MAVGRNVQGFKPGDEVFGDLSGWRGFGGFAEYVCARATALVPKSLQMSFVQAAAIPQAGMLALECVRARGPLQAGQKVLINGAGGGVGTFAVQLAKLHDVEVTGVDSAGKLDMMRSIGFDHVIDYRQVDFTARGKRYDLIVDAKTNRSPRDYARALNHGGVYATSGGKRLLELAVVGRSVGRAENKKLFLVMLRPNRELPYYNQLFEAGKLRPVIDGPYKLSEAREAFRRFGAAEHKGKIVITID
jgi:NADPH:quinone reductase-like Zn-dependent oxidoreductase